MLPDGGIARLRVFGEVVIDWMHIKSSEMIVYTKTKRNDGGRWETARKVTRPAILTSNPSTGLLEVPDKDWVVLKLGHLGVIHQVEVDTNHFKRQPS
ncbi:hypothetical protein PsorP6_005832 [Peronosclerospora sorghi]|uniref:Uncharacterized protein n=1 Tax=Peronosclerospora sorghi TaxID=230839 RepID=A0ACC0W5K8_9STRA|nr:hypothetical protein PsorP6_005832 [Peronosclerospora sorghi]